MSMKPDSASAETKRSPPPGTGLSLILHAISTLNPSNNTTQLLPAFNPYLILPMNPKSFVGAREGRFQKARWGNEIWTSKKGRGRPPA
jgi:hypothetical protein